MLFRAIALSLALLVGIGTVSPFISETTQATPNNKKKYKKLKKYSKAWWRWYHKQQRKKRSVVARKRALLAKRILLARQKAQSTKRAETPNPTVAKPIKAIKENQIANNEVQIPVNDTNGKSVGTVSLSIFGQATKPDQDNGLTKKIGGVPTSSLRQDVVAKMVKENGWVINDYHKNLNGRKVYLVVAQCPSKGAVQSRLFYFTEVDGRIYSVSTTCSDQSQEQIEQKSEKMIRSLQQGSVTNLVGLK